MAEFEPENLMKNTSMLTPRMLSYCGQFFWEMDPGCTKLKTAGTQ